MATSAPQKTLPLAPQASVLLDILHRIQKIDPEFPIQYAICLIVISQNEGFSITNLAEKSGLALSTVSRIVGALSNYRQLGQPYHFVEVKVSEAERRRKELYLTDLGRASLKEILSPIEKLV
jgi:DNA-binding MarR family transcriptional regulator